MRETELKAVVEDQKACEARLLEAGARLVLNGRIEDARYDTPGQSFFQQGLSLRVRVTRVHDGVLATLDFKGMASYDGGYKTREETSVTLPDADGIAKVLRGIGLEVTLEIDRDVRSFVLGAATVRFERFPRMDTLVEVEGPADAIERAIAALGMERSAFTPEPLTAFVSRYEARTGSRAAISAREARGEYRFERGDA